MLAPRIAHIITDLDGFGGTEATLLRYIVHSGIPMDCHRVLVLKSIGSGDALGAQMLDAGIAVRALGLQGGGLSLQAVLRLQRELREFGPDVISGWLYHPSLLASLLAPLLGLQDSRPAVAWHIRSSTYASLLQTPGRYLAQRALALLSRLSHPAMVSNSRSAAVDHAAIGFDGDAERWTIIPNGVDTARFTPQAGLRQAAREELRVASDALLVGCVGRFVPEKGYQIMFEALGRVLRALPSAISSRVHFVAMGEGASIDNPTFAQLAAGCMPRERLRLLGKRADVEHVLRALDLYVLPSIGEAFPNSLVEAMASGLACIATDVGECREVLASAECIVMPGDARGLAERIVLLLTADDRLHAALGEQNRRRVVGHFGLHSMVAGFDSLFARVAATGRHGASEPAG